MEPRAVGQQSWGAVGDTGAGHTHSWATWRLCAFLGRGREAPGKSDQKGPEAPGSGRSL